MILYVDASALVKRYVREIYSSEVSDLLLQADIVACAYVTKPEVVASIVKSRQVGVLWPNLAKKVLEQFRLDWDDYRQLPITEEVINRADKHAWDYELRGFDAIHLAAAEVLQGSLDELVTFATYDRKLWQAAQQVGLEVWPQNLV